MSDYPQASREKYWDEKSTEEKIENLAEAVEIIGKMAIEARKNDAFINQHEHTADGKLVIPLIHNEPETPWYQKHLLNRRPK